METNRLLSNFIPSNVYRVSNVGKVQKRFPKEYPDLLQGAMKESAYVDYLKRVEEAAHIPMLLAVMIISPFVFAIPAPLILVAADKYVAGMAYLVFWGSYSVSMLAFGIIGTRIMLKKAKLRVSVVIEDVNQKYRSRGVKWAYIPGSRDTETHIDITLFNPDNADRVYIPTGASSINGDDLDLSTDDEPSSFYRTFSSEPAQMMMTTKSSIIPSSSHEKGSLTFDTYPGDSAMGAIID